MQVALTLREHLSEADGGRWRYSVARLQQILAFFRQPFQIADQEIEAQIQASVDRVLRGAPGADVEQLRAAHRERIVHETLVDRLARNRESAPFNPAQVQQQLELLADINLRRLSEYLTGVTESWERRGLLIRTASILTADEVGVLDEADAFSYFQLFNYSPLSQIILRLIIEPQPAFVQKFISDLGYNLDPREQVDLLVFMRSVIPYAVMTYARLLAQFQETDLDVVIGPDTLGLNPPDPSPELIQALNQVVGLTLPWVDEAGNTRQPVLPITDPGVLGLPPTTRPSHLAKIWLLAFYRYKVGYDFKFISNRLYLEYPLLGNLDVEFRTQPQAVKDTAYLARFVSNFGLPTTVQGPRTPQNYLMMRLIYLYFNPDYDPRYFRKLFLRNGLNWIVQQLSAFKVTTIEEVTTIEGVTERNSYVQIQQKETTAPTPEDALTVLEDMTRSLGSLVEALVSLEWVPGRLPYVGETVGARLGSVRSQVPRVGINRYVRPPYRATTTFRPTSTVIRPGTPTTLISPVVPTTTTIPPPRVVGTLPAPVVPAVPTARVVPPTSLPPPPAMSPKTSLMSIRFPVVQFKPPASRITRPGTTPTAGPTIAQPQREPIIASRLTTGRQDSYSEADLRRLANAYGLKARGTSRQDLINVLLEYIGQS